MQNNQFLYIFLWVATDDVYFSTTHCSLLKFIVRSGLDVPTIATRRLHACHHVRAPSGGRWNCGREMSGKFCLSAEFHVTFRDLLHAVKLRHGTDGFTSPPKEGVLRIFRPKNPTASTGCEPANLCWNWWWSEEKKPKNIAQVLCKFIKQQQKCCKLSVFYNGCSSDCYFLFGLCTKWWLNIPTFRTNILSPSSGRLNCFGCVLR